MQINKLCRLTGPDRAGLWLDSGWLEISALGEGERVLSSEFSLSACIRLND